MINIYPFPVSSCHGRPMKNSHSKNLQAKDTHRTVFKDIYAHTKNPQAEKSPRGNTPTM